MRRGCGTSQLYERLDSLVGAIVLLETEVDLIRGLGFDPMPRGALVRQMTTLEALLSEQRSATP